MEVNSQPHVPASYTSGDTTTGTSGIGGCVGAGTITDSWKINTSHASTRIRSTDRLARKLAARLNTLFRFCPLFVPITRLHITILIVCILCYFRKLQNV
jgi:hypothetical protein